MNCILCNKPVSKIIADTLRAGEKRNVFLCPRCELGMLDEVRDASELKKFYAEEYRKVGKPKIGRDSGPAELFSIYSRFQDDRLKLLAPYFGKNKSLLEIGCSAGMFLYHAKKKGGEIAGTDFDIVSAKFAAKKCGCPVYTTDIRETPLLKKHFDIIATFQTLEHVKDPHDFIESAKEYLAPRGTIAVEIPNLYDALAHIYNLPRHYRFFYHAAHLWYFTEKSLEKLMKEHGFVGKVFHTQDYNILNHLHWIDRDAPDSDCIKGLSAPSLPFRKNVPPETKKKLTDFIRKMDTKYKSLLAEQKITSNLLYIGTLR